MAAPATLYDAASRGDLTAVKAFIASGADVNQTTESGASPLYIASQFGYLEIVKALIAEGADVNTTMNDVPSPLFIASLNGHLEVVKALIAASAGVNHTNFYDQSLWIASLEGHLEIVKALLAAGADVNNTQDNGESPLFVASQDGHIEIVKELIAAGADVNNTQDNGESPLYIASQKGYYGIVKALIEADADVNKTRNDGTSPLYIASQNGRLEIVKLLIAAHADVNKTLTSGGASPLYIASQSGYIEIVQALLAAHADVNKTMTSGASPLYIASQNGRLQVVKALLASEADVTIYNVLQKARDRNFNPEINELIIAKAESTGSKEMWSGFTRSDIAKFNAIFETEASEGKRPRAENVSVCPVCLAYTERSEGCKYMKHNCMLDTGAPNKKLYDMYKSSTGLIYWCTICGRICDGHHHYKLSYHTEKASRAPELTGVVDYYSSDCVKEGGGGLMEKLARFRRMREYALELNDQVGKITKTQAMTELVEETWDAPLVRVRKLEKIAANKKWNISSENFLPNVVPTRANNSANNYPNIIRPNANKPLIPTTSRGLNDFDEEQTFIQFHHRMANGEINNHEGNLISQPLLQGFIEDINKQFGTPAFGLCWDYRNGAGCTARLYPEEILGFVTNDVYDTYRKQFNKKFAAAEAGAGAVGGRHRKTYKQKRIQKGGVDNMLKEALYAECVLPPKGGRRRTQKRHRYVRNKTKNSRKYFW